jgi:hypothetical protein
MDFYLLLWLGPLYIVGTIVYRLFLHPLAGFPGPKLAAVTHLYEFYFNLVQDGMFIWEVERMHAQYGTFFSIHNFETK